ncbi:MAG: hypothetical protein ABL901_06535 [Hyphomicrobiaceae bacterium]
MENNDNRRQAKKRRSEPLPKLVVFLITRAATGALVGVAIAATLVATNTRGLRDLIEASTDQIAPALLLGVGFASLFGSLWAAVAVMLQLWDD